MDYLPDDIWYVIYEYNRDLPSKMFSTNFHKVKTVNNLREYKTIQIKSQPWVLWKCIYCRRPKGWAKVQDKIKRSRIPFYKLDYTIGCDC